MKKIIPLALLMISFIYGMAQDPTVKSLQTDAGKQIKKEEDTLNRVWRNGGLFNLNLSQGNLTNWAAGGDDFSLSLNSYLHLYSFYKKGKNSWDNTLDINFGYIKTTSLGSRKNDDRFDIVSKYGHAISSKWNASILFNFRSQMANGYTYATNVPTYSSTFLAPAYILLSPGLDYKPSPNFSFFISPITARWVIVNDDTLSAKGLYGVEPGKTSNGEFGAFASVNYFKELNKSITYRGRLDLFSNYKRNPQNVDLFMTNVFAVKLAKVLSATWNIDFIYDDDVKLFGKNGKSPALQIKSLIGVGLQVKF